jgi:hypothetical protein
LGTSFIHSRNQLAQGRLSMSSSLAKSLVDLEHSIKFAVNDFFWLLTFLQS